jgi:hypothetical protein
MSNAALPAQGQVTRTAPVRLSIAGLQGALLWLFIACGAFASIEPSPYEIFFVLAVLAFGMRGLSFDRSLIPLILGLAVFNVGGILALTPFIQEHESATFIAISVYISVTAIFFAALIAKSPLERMRTIRSGYVTAGCIASCFAIVGYFDIGGMAEHFTLYGRASGTFKDPNVLGSFLAPPLVWLAQDVMLKRSGALLRGILPMLVMLAALLLTFSRGSWGVWAASSSCSPSRCRFRPFATFSRCARRSARTTTLAKPGALARNCARSPCCSICPSALARCSSAIISMAKTRTTSTSTPSPLTGGSAAWPLRPSPLRRSIWVGGWSSSARRSRRRRSRSGRACSSRYCRASRSTPTIGAICSY